MLSTAPSYAYNASAIALGGVLRQGNQSIVIPTIGSVSLASAGGEAENRVDNYFRDDISFDRAETRVSGYSAPFGAGLRRYTTYSEVTLKNLKIFDRLYVGFMKAIVTSTRIIDPNASERILQLEPDSSEFSIRLLYENVVVDGEEVAPTADFELCHAGTYDKFLQRAATLSLGVPEDTDQSFEAIKKVKQLREEKPVNDPVPPTPAAVVVPWHRPPVNMPLVRLQGPPGLVSPHGNRANVQSFGKARFGDAVIKPDRQRVALLRLTLDSGWQTTRPATDAGDFEAVANDGTSSLISVLGDGNGGSLSGGDGGNNGVPIWP